MRRTIKFASMTLAIVTGVSIAAVVTAAPAHATTLVDAVPIDAAHGDDVWAAPESLTAVINNIRNWLIGLLVALATLLLTVGGVRYLLAGGDPGEVAKAKDTLKYAAIGYAVAALAPLLVSILKKLVGA